MKRWTIRGAPTLAQIEEIANLLRSGGIVLMPTDTIYGLHALANDDRAAGRLRVIKGRQESKPFVILAASVAQLASLGCVIPEILHQTWPAPLTAILRCGASTLAARVPDLLWLRDLLERTGPLISTSANRSGALPILEPNQLAPELLKAIDGVADAGRREGKASAIVDFTETEPRFIRGEESRFTQLLRKSLRK